MKTKLIRLTCFLTALLALATVARAQGTAFTYQGRLNNNGAPANGSYDLQFTIHSAASGAAQVGSMVSSNALAVSNGLFTVTLDFGNQFPGTDRWLEIAVRTNGGGAFATLVPRQLLTATPYAITAGSLSGVLASASLSGPYANAVTLNNGANSFSGNGANLTALNAAQLASGTVPAAALGNAWRIGGNVGTTPGTQFVGTTDNQPLELKVNNQRVLRLEPNDSSPNLIGGYAGNSIGTGSFGSVIAGGGYPGLVNTMGNNASLNVIGGGYNNNIAAYAAYATIAGGSYSDIGTNSYSSAIGGGEGNNIAADSPQATINGGYLNDIGTNSRCSAIGGGNDNNIAPNSGYATIAGGRLNAIGANSPYSAIGGGSGNNIAADSWLATIAGGRSNDISTNSDYSAIGGGYGNYIAVNSEYATIPGGGSNAATSYAFAAGYRAKANHIGAFVWGDSTFADIASTTANSVTMRASGGYWLFSNSGATAGVSLAADGTAWAVISDRNVKKDFASVNGRQILEKLAALPITQWHYQWEGQNITPHIGPMAQDFKAAFYPGADDKSITTQEADGVAFAAIQGLNQKVDSENATLRAENLELKQRLEKLERLMNQKNGGAR